MMSPTALTTISPPVAGVRVTVVGGGLAGVEAAAHAGGHGDFLDDLGENLAPLGVGSTLFMFDSAPFIMT